MLICCARFAKIPEPGFSRNALGGGGQRWPVGSGDLGLEVDIPQLAADIEGAATEYDPSNYHGLYVRFTDDGPLITVYRTGKYIISGCS